MGEKPTLLMFISAGGTSEVEQVVARAKQAIAVDTIETVVRLGLCEQAIVATNCPHLADQLAPLRVIVEQDDEEPFHFGNRLRALIRSHGVERPLYVGAGSTALLTGSELAAICHQFAASQRGIITNNLFSSDFVGFVPGDSIEDIEPPATDNNLAFLLNRKALLPVLPLPRTVGNQFDVDTPTDLLILSLQRNVGPRTRAYLQSLSLDTRRTQAVARLLTDSAAEVVVAGRVGAGVWLRLEQDTACRIRLFSEERGMRASGREEGGDARSLLGFYLEGTNPRRLFDTLAQLGSAAIIDSRVIFAHLHLRLSAADRFNSDLLRPSLIADPRAREFTVAALDAPLPVLLGGHSVVSGGLLALVDHAWSMTQTSGLPRSRKVL